MERATVQAQEVDADPPPPRVPIPIVTAQQRADHIFATLKAARADAERH